MRISLWNKTVILLAGMSLVACSSGYSSRSPADIKPVYQVRNSPIPVPHPRFKPKPPNRYAAQRTSPKAQTQSSVARSDYTASGQGMRTVTVQKGDTLYAISRREGVGLQDLVQANKLRPPYALAIGQKLVVHTSSYHTVRRGETSYGISRQYGINLSDLIRVNDIRKPYTLSVGQKLRIPGGGVQSASNTASSQPRTTAKQAPGRTVAIPTPPPRTGSGFAWPVKGTISSRFGPKEGGLHNDGVNILVKRGTAVKAAESGVVVYASNALEGYGNLLLVRHAGGWVTAYAHNERLLVRHGQKVTKGQVIARAGSTGGVATPQLHFEIRKGRRALDPLRYLS